MKLIMRLVCLLLLVAVGTTVGMYAVLSGKDYWATQRLRPVAYKPKPRTPEQIEALRIERTTFEEETLPADPVISTSTLRIGGPEHALAGQLINEGFLMVSREDFGIPTRDDYLRETIVPEAHVDFEPTLMILQPGPVNKVRSYRIDLTKLFGERENVILANVPVTEELVLDVMLRELERLTTEDYPRLLEQVGFQKCEPPAMPAPDVGDLLLTTPPLDVITIFGRLRRLHQALAAAPRSPEVIATLSEHYAVLGSLTELHWGQEGKIFKARALLYAQRGLQFHPEAARLHWSHAFALGLTGLDYRSKPAIERAREMSEPDEIPGWADSLEAFVTWKEPELERLAEADKPFARYLRMLAVEMCGTETQFLAAVSAVVKDSPECYRASAVLAHTGGLGVRRAVERAQLEQFLLSFPKTLQSFSDLPAPVNAAAQAVSDASEREDKMAATAELIKVLREAARTDRKEPSLGALATLAENLHMIFAVQILATLRFQLATDADDEIPFFETLLQHHPAKVILGAYQKDRQKAAQAGSQALIPVLRLGPSYFTWSMTHRIPGNYGGILGMRMNSETDSTTPELLQTINANGVLKAREEWLKKLRQVSPDCPLTKGYLIKMHWDEAAPHVEEWLSEAVNPNLFNEAGSHYLRSALLNDGDFPLAEKYYKKFLELDHSYTAYANLADLYRNEEKEELYRETLKESLALPNTGLEGARAHNKIARSLMLEGKYVEAQPHASAAAASYSHWGLIGEVECLEGLGKWDKAAEIMHADALRYNQGYLWYMWCRRTGHEDLEVARDYCTTVTSRTVRQSRDGELTIAIFDLLDGNRPDAIRILQKFVESHPQHAMARFYLSLALYEEGQIEEAAKLYRSDVALSTNRFIFEAWLRPRAEGAPALSSVEEEFFADLWPLQEGPTFSQCYIGQLLHADGNDEEAIPWLQRAEASIQGAVVERTLAGATLRDLNIPCTPPSASPFDKRFPHVRNRFARFATANKTQDPQACQAFLQKLVDETPDWLVGKFWLGNWAFEHDDYATAQKCYTELSQNLPNLPQLHVFRGRVFEHQGKFKEALAEYEAALKVSPKDRLAESNLAWILASAPVAELRDGARALALAQALPEGDGDYRAINTLLLSAAQAECGNFEQAAKTLETAREKKLLNQFSADPFLECYRAHKPYHDLPKNSKFGALKSRG